MSPIKKVHVNPNFVASGEAKATSSRVHINPHFNKSSNNPNVVYINPKAVATSTSASKSCKSSINATPKSSNVYINPNWGRALPPVPGSSSNSSPHINPKFVLDAQKTKEYQEAIKNVIQDSSVVINSASAVSSSKKTFIDPKEQKENHLPETGTSSQDQKSETGITKRISSFKKIGNRKLIRISRRKSASERSPSIKKTPKTPTTLIYKVKTSNKIIKTTPKSSAKKKTPGTANNKSVSAKLRKTPFSKILNPFKIDRRRVKRKSSSNIIHSPIQRRQLRNKKTPSPNVLKNKKIIGEETYSVTNTSLKRLVPPPKPVRTTNPTPLKSNLITVQGIKYNVSENGRKLKRVENGDETPKNLIPPTIQTKNNFGVSRKLFLEGEEYIEDEPGVLIRSRNSMTRQSITSYRNRSINTIIKSQTRCKQYCMFFNKFGKCNKRDKGVCPYIHDSSKVAVCRKFLQGICVNEKCLLSHKVAPEKMPSCKFFMEGLCVRDNCPYRHVKVNSEAEICQEYLKGFCSLGSECKKQHADKYPSKTPKKKPPVKPKRKSLGATPMVTQEKKARLRYYEDNKKEDEEEEEEVGEESYEYKERKKRLFKKIELVKQGWSGVATVEKEVADNLDDSGPYEEIDDEPLRPPVGELPSFISLSKYGSSDEDEDKKHPPSSPPPPPPLPPANKIVDVKFNEPQIVEDEIYEERLI